MKDASILLLLFVIVLIASSCAPQAESPPVDSIQNIVWQWQTVDDRESGSSTTVPNPEVYTIVFHQDGTIEGQADCNTFSGTYSQDGGFFITAQPDVMAACDLGSLDSQYLGLLDEVVAGGPDGAGGLALETAAGVQRMTFSNGGAAPVE